jgi:heat shock protein HtpX
MYNQIAANKRNSFFILFIFLVFVIGVGYVFSKIYDSPIILVIAVLYSLVQALVSYYQSDKIALLAAGAKEAKRAQFIGLFRVVENLSITSGLPQPKIYVINDPAPNAFATGRDPKNASIAVTSGLLERLSKTELEGVIAHELSHVGNYDIRLMTIVVVLVGVIALISDWGLRAFFWRDRDDREGSGYLILIALALYILAPISAILIQLASSRKREYLADATGALMTRNPEGLASALEKISSYDKPLIHQNRAIAHLYIASPSNEKKQSWFVTAFSTHPPIKDRIKKLREMIS